MTILNIQENLLIILLLQDIFNLWIIPEHTHDALDQVEKDKADLIVEIPEGFERDLIRESETKVLLAANAISGQTAGLSCCLCKFNC